MFLFCIYVAVICFQQYRANMEKRAKEDGAIGDEENSDKSADVTIDADLKVVSIIITGETPNQVTSER